MIRPVKGTPVPDMGGPAMAELTTAEILGCFYSELIDTEMPSNLVNAIVVEFARGHMDAGIQLGERDGG